MCKAYHLLFAVIFLIFSLQAQGQEKVNLRLEDRTISSPDGINFSLIGRIDQGAARGITETGIFNDLLEVVPGAQSPRPRTNLLIPYVANPVIPDEDWMLIDTLSFDSYVPANKSIGAKFNSSTHKLEIITPYTFSSEAREAIAKSPKWIRPALENTLGKLSSAKQIALARVILDADFPYIDEIAYSIAYSSSQYLSSKYCNPKLFLENAQSIYKHDSDLKYVELLEVYEPVNGSYTTVRYWRQDSTLGKVSILVPKEIYYMYIVHPKISDEIPAYVNPDLLEYDTISGGSHTLNIVDPSEGGVFWRDYLYSHTEEKPGMTGELFPVLRDSLINCDVLWDDKKEMRNPITEITKWIKSVMNFNSGTERPHQPVRIYDLHLGRCGEHEDITAAAARASLIPCRCIEAYSSDHVWNEFWDKQWWQWEPVNYSIRDNFVYSKGWGKKFGSILARVSNGGSEQVTKEYVDGTAQLTVYVIDNNGKPVDGAVIMLAAKKTLDQTSLFIDSYGVTDIEGKYSFVISASRDYFARVDSPLGSYPTTSGQVIEILADPSESGEYEYSLTINGAIPNPKFKSTTAPEDPQMDYLMVAQYNAEQQVINWRLLFNDIGGEYTYDYAKDAEIYSFVCDETNYQQSYQNMKYDVNSMSLNNKGEYTYNIPADRNWYFLLNNSNSYSNLVHVNANYKLYAYKTVGTGNDAVQAEVLSQNYPNPFIKTTNIKINISKPEFYRLGIYNYSGDLIKYLTECHLGSGEYTFSWDGTDKSGSEMPAGVYFYRLESNTRSQVKSLIKVK